MARRSQEGLTQCAVGGGVDKGWGHGTMGWDCTGAVSNARK